MYLDASAVLALVLEEPEAPGLARRIDGARTGLITSPVSVTEAVLRYASVKGVAILAARELIGDALAALAVRTVSITPEIGDAAIQAYARYGKGTGHPAQLNLGDVFSYACAKAHQVPLLYKGNDFVHTDLA
ncbi:MAG TPA: type II toxin-antitoxin system VapC family toxin [Microvirga sp.]|jgi:ribonuclease VapC|nr:type II toxin-antitoxin system VapC family toxin [Microvirga sp.]